MSRPKISVIVPTHNGARYLRQALTSVASQEGPTREILVMDDASDDETPDIARSFGASVTYYRLPKQPRHIRVTNLGISRSSGEYFLVLHDDDFLKPGKLAAHVELMDANPGVGFSYSRQAYVGPDGRTLARLSSPVSTGSYVVRGSEELRHLAVQNYVNFSNAVVRRSSYESVGPFPEHLWVSAEWVVWSLLAARYSVGHVARELTAYRVHAESQTLAGTRNTAEYRAQLTEGFERIWGDDLVESSARGVRSLSEANVSLSMALLHLMRKEPFGALKAFTHVVDTVPPSHYRQLIRSSAIVPRVMSRVNLLTGAALKQKEATPDPAPLRINSAPSAAVVTAIQTSTNDCIPA